MSATGRKQQFLPWFKFRPLGASKESRQKHKVVFNTEFNAKFLLDCFARIGIKLHRVDDLFKREGHLFRFGTTHIFSTITNE